MCYKQGAGDDAGSILTIFQKGPLKNSDSHTTQAILYITRTHSYTEVFRINVYVFYIIFTVCFYFCNTAAVDHSTFGLSKCDLLYFFDSLEFEIQKIILA